MNTVALLMLFGGTPLAADPFKPDPFKEALRTYKAADPFAIDNQKPIERKPVYIFAPEAAKRSVPFESRTFAQRVDFSSAPRLGQDPFQAPTFTSTAAMFGGTTISRRC